MIVSLASPLTNSPAGHHAGSRTVELRLAGVGTACRHGPHSHLMDWLVGIQFSLLSHGIWELGGVD